jgi:hypothetical protein
MSLANDISFIIPQLRAQAEGRMVDTCEVGTFAETVDPTTFETIKTLVESQYAGKCRITSKSNAVSERQAGSQSFADQALVLSVPVADGGLIRTDATVKITAVDAVTGNPAMVNRSYRVAGLANGSQSTAARFLLEALS